MRNRLKKFFKTLGPGFITGAADDDPTAIAAYSQSGAQFGFGLLWTAIFTLPFMTVVQEMSGRIGMVTGKGLAGVIRKHYPSIIIRITVILLLVSNAINIGANLGAMAASAQLIWNLPFAVWLIAITALILFLEIFLTYRVYARYLKFMALFLLAYVGVVFTLNLNWGEVFMSSIFPSLSFNKFYLLALVAVLGTNISPYLFFWQSNEEIEEGISNGKIKEMGRGTPVVTKHDLKMMRRDTGFGMLFSNVIIFFVGLAAAATLGAQGITDIETPAQAAQALIPIAGNFAFILFALGILGSGFLAVPILSGSASYAMAETFGWKEGFYKKFRQAHGFYGIITFATLIGLMINFINISPFKMLIYAAALNGLLAPFLLILILAICNNEKIMGRHTNKWLSNMFGILITVIMFAGGIALIWNW